MYLIWELAYDGINEWKHKQRSTNMSIDEMIIKAQQLRYTLGNKTDVSTITLPELVELDEQVNTFVNTHYKSDLEMIVRIDNTWGITLGHMNAVIRGDIDAIELANTNRIIVCRLISAFITRLIKSR